MKKTHFNLWSTLRFFIMFSVLFMLSCTTEENNKAPDDLALDLVLEKGYLLPVSVTNQSADYIDNHLSEISLELQTTYLNNYIVGKYLEYFGKANLVANSLLVDENLSEVDLSNVLTQRELDLVNSNLIKSNQETQISRQGCTKIYIWSNCCWKDRNTGNCVGAWCGNGCWPSSCGSNC